LAGHIAEDKETMEGQKTRKMPEKRHGVECLSKGKKEAELGGKL